MGDVRVGEEGDVGDRVIADEEVVLRKMLFHNFQGGPTAVAFGRKQRGALGCVRAMPQRLPGGCRCFAD
jgi:hypothetical protein